MLGASEAYGKASPCKECGETFDVRIPVYLKTRLGHGVEDRTACQEGSMQLRLPYTQFVRMLFASHGIQGTCFKNPEEVVANQWPVV